MVLVAATVTFVGVTVTQFVTVSALIGTERVRRRENELKEMSAAWMAARRELTEAAWEQGERMEACRWTRRHPTRRLMAARYEVQTCAKGTGFERRAVELVAWLTFGKVADSSGELDRVTLGILVEALIDAMLDDLEAAGGESSARH